MKPSIFYFSMAALLGLGTLLGCGKSPYEVARASGRITLNGQPLTGATVMFYPMMKGDYKVGKPAYSSLGPEGRFVLSTYGNEDGAVVGPHGVRIYRIREKEKKWRPGMPKPTKLQPTKKKRVDPLADWAEVSVPGQLEVVSGKDNQFEIELTDEILKRFATLGD